MHLLPLKDFISGRWYFHLAGKVKRVFSNSWTLTSCVIAGEVHGTLKQVTSARAVHCCL